MTSASDEVMQDTVMQDTAHRLIVRVGDTVHRPVQPWTPAIHELLRHLEAVGFRYAPRVLGIDEHGREILSYIPGDSGPEGWARVVGERGLAAFGRLLREYHDAVADFAPQAGTAWATGAVALEEGWIVCHGDFGPWNIVWQDTTPVGIIDWDYARPGPPLFDLAYGAEYTSPFRDDAECLENLRYPTPPDRRRRLALLCAAYGLASSSGVVDAVIRGQQEDTELVRRLAEQGQEPQATWVGEGYLSELDARVAWSQIHRHLFE